MSIATCAPGGDISSNRLETGVNSGSDGIEYQHAFCTANQIGTYSPLPETVPNLHCSTSTGVLASPLSRTELDASRDGWTHDRRLHEIENENTGQKIKKKHLALTWQDFTVNGAHSKSVLGDDIMYSWSAFGTAQLVAELPYLLICGFLYFACFYFTAGLPVKASVSGQIFFVMILYEFLYTAVGEAIAAISPNDFFAALLNPLIIVAFLIKFAGFLVPYDQIIVSWKYWMSYLDLFTYVIGALLAQLLCEVNVVCKEKEMAQFIPPPGQTCSQYMEEFIKTGTGYIFDNSTRTVCDYCPFKEGSEFGKTLNLSNRYDGWKDTDILAIFCISTYVVVFLMMKLRSKKTKSATSE